MSERTGEADDIEEIKERKLEELRRRAEDDEGHGEAPDEPIHVDGAEELQDAVETYDRVLVDFFAEWCGPCKMMDPIVTEIAADTDLAVAKVDIDQNQDIAQQAGVRGVPTFHAYVEGEQVGELVGAQERETLLGAFGR